MELSKLLPIVVFLISTVSFAGSTIKIVDKNYRAKVTELNQISFDFEDELRKHRTMVAILVEDMSQEGYKNKRKHSTIKKDDIRVKLYKKNM